VIGQNALAMCIKVLGKGTDTLLLDIVGCWEWECVKAF